MFVYWNLKLKESEAKFRTLFDIAPVFLNSFDKNGKIILWNKECEKAFGWTFDEIKNKKNSLSLFYDDPKVCEDVMKSFENISNSFEEWHPKTKNGETLVVKWANIKLPNGETINIGLDITQQRNYEISIREKALELKVAKLQLENLNSSLEKRIEDEIKKNTKQQHMIMQQNKLAQMGEMIENIAHQWRQPLAQINSSIILIDAILEKHNFKDTLVENKLTEIESLTSYMSKTISDFKNFFSPNKKKTIFKVEDAIQKANDVLKGLINSHHIQMEISVEKDLTQFYQENVALGDQINMIFSSSHATYGRGKAIITGVGATTEIGRIASLLKSAKEKATPLQESLDRFGKILAPGNQRR